MFVCIGWKCVDETWQVFCLAGRCFTPESWRHWRGSGFWPTCNYIKVNVEKTALIMSLGVQRRTLVHKQEHWWELSLTHLLVSFSCCTLDVLARSLKGGHCVPDSSHLQHFQWILLFSFDTLLGLSHAPALKELLEVIALWLLCNFPGNGCLKGRLHLLQVQSEWRYLYAFWNAQKDEKKQPITQKRFHIPK